MISLTIQAAPFSPWAGRTPFGPRSPNIDLIRYLMCIFQGIWAWSGLVNKKCSGLSGSLVIIKNLTKCPTIPHNSAISPSTPRVSPYLQSRWTFIPTPIRRAGIFWTADNGISSWARIPRVRIRSTPGKEDWGRSRVESGIMRSLVQKWTWSEPIHAILYVLVMFVVVCSFHLAPNLGVGLSWCGP